MNRRCSDQSPPWLPRNRSSEIASSKQLQNITRGWPTNTKTRHQPSANSAAHINPTKGSPSTGTTIQPTDTSPCNPALTGPHGPTEWGWRSKSPPPQKENHPSRNHPTTRHHGQHKQKHGKASSPRLIHRQHDVHKPAICQRTTTYGTRQQNPPTGSKMHAGRPSDHQSHPTTRSCQPTPGTPCLKRTAGRPATCPEQNAET